MKIAKTSWHYRFNNFNNDRFERRFEYGQYTTCSYIRTTIASMLAFLFKSFCVLIVIGIGLFIVGSMIAVPIMIYLEMTPPELPIIMCIVAWISSIAGLAILLMNQIQEVIENYRHRNGDKPVTEPNVFVQAIIDKHNKFCTLVTAE